MRGSNISSVNIVDFPLNITIFSLEPHFFIHTLKTSEQAKYAEGRNKLDLYSAVDWFLKIFVDNMPLNALKLQIRWWQLSPFE